jgi:uncharacterized protein
MLDSEFRNLCREHGVLLQEIASTHPGQPLGVVRLLSPDLADSWESQRDRIHAHVAGLNRRGAWLPTYSGAILWPQDPHPEDFYILDIAQGLAFTRRFNGHLTNDYYVAQHCVLASRLVPSEFALEALLHDASEAYIADVASPVKSLLPDYRAIEAGIQSAIYERFGVRPSEESHAAVKEVDRRLLVTEAMHFFPLRHLLLAEFVPCLPGWLEAWDHERAKREYLQRFDELYVNRADLQPVRSGIDSSPG